MEASIGSVFLAAFITALVTGLGAVPFLFVHHISAWWLSVANGAAAGVMLGAWHNLIAEGTKLDAGRMLLGIVAGLIAIVAANGLIRRRRMVEIADLHGASARKALLLLGVMTAHSFAEGVGVGVSFGGAGELGVFITTAIAIHNIPEGLAILGADPPGHLGGEGIPLEHLPEPAATADGRTSLCLCPDV